MFEAGVAWSLALQQGRDVWNAEPFLQEIPAVEVCLLTWSG